MRKNYIHLHELEVYRLARELSRVSWLVFEKLPWPDKKIMGEQFIRSVDSVGANIAEGYARFHYLDRVRFYYQSRSSLSEACDHWLELLLERRKISNDDYEEIKSIQKPLEIKLNNFIKSTFHAAQQKE